jgi:uncharacterized protein (DUF427 family)
MNIEIKDLNYSERKPCFIGGSKWRMGMKAVWNGIVLAESDKAIRIEEEYFFPVASVKMDHLKKLSKNSYCRLKGNACYYDVIANGKTLSDGAMSYESPHQEATQYRDFISFTRDVQIKK